jgi:tyrosyl-tRNA synthetase
MISLLAFQTCFLKSKGEARRALSENSISVNKTKVDESYNIESVDLIDDQYILLQRGKKNYFIVKVVG